jgi:LmbE family N-acetylglucosaminyl deacetylase/ActR/RegA family two-component response regulator
MTDSAHDGPPGRVLIIEDDPVAAHFAMQVLGKRGGLDVRHTPDPAVALSLARSETWDLVLTDAELPGMTGLEILSALRRLSPGLPVAVITAHESLDPAMRELRDAADEFLQKPVRPDHFLATVTALVAKGRAVRLAARLAARPAVLAIGAHPGDVEIGAAGALLVHRGQGHEISILILGRAGCGAVGGNDDRGAGAPGAAAGQAAAGKDGGSELAAIALGATLFQADLPDPAISADDPAVAAADRAVSAIGRAIQAVRPAVVYTHSPHDENQDHRDAHRAALVACRDVASVYCFQSPSATVDFRPGRFVTIDDQFGRKLLVINARTAQRRTGRDPEPNLIESTARYWSRFSGGRYAEAFEVVREPAATAG